MKRLDLAAAVGSFALVIVFVAQALGIAATSAMDHWWGAVGWLFYGLHCLSDCAE